MGKIMNNNIYPNLKGVTGAYSTNTNYDSGFIRPTKEDIKKKYKYYNTLSDEELIEAIRDDFTIFNYLINPSYKVCKEALKLKDHGFLIKYIDDPSEELQLIAINDNVRFLYLIKNPTVNTINRCIQLSMRGRHYSFICFIQKFLKNINVEDLCIEGIEMLIYSGLEDIYLDEEFKKSFKYKQALINLEV